MVARTANEMTKYQIQSIRYKSITSIRMRVEFRLPQVIRQKNIVAFFSLSHFTGERKYTSQRSIDSQNAKLQQIELIHGHI